MISTNATASWIEEKAFVLVNDLAARLSTENGISSMSPTIYDTAWVSMIAKTVDCIPRWRFPECFDYILDKQMPDGGWEAYASEIDGILNTMAALLAMKRHLAMPECLGCPMPMDIGVRIARATSNLEQRLEDWDIQATLHVGFEVLVPSLLVMLEEFSPQFAFRGREKLFELNKTKLAGFDPRVLYAKQQTTLIHSLEAFIGDIDFSSVRHHMVLNSMMASPSSTAAYLMHSSPWDNEAEAYIENVIANGPGAGGGSVPSAFPSTIFELTWSLSTLLEAGFPVESLGDQALARIQRFLENQLSCGNGLIGFAPQLMSDADDTAKAILALTLLGCFVDPSRMIENFESLSCFLTFRGERDPSFSANCNILNALLHMPAPNDYRKQILKATAFLCNTWDHEVVRDKWNLSEYYPMMLLAHCLVQLLHLWDSGRLVGLPDALIQTQIPVILTQILTRVLQDQRSDGSWGKGSSYEVTAYALLALKTTSAGPWASTLLHEARHATEQASSFLEQHRANWQQADYTWVEKVTYRSPILSQVYCLAALRTSSDSSWGDNMTSLGQLPPKAVNQCAKFFGSLPLFSNMPGWLLNASIIESYPFRSRLEQIRSSVFPAGEAAKHQYLSYLPITWVATNNNCRTRLSNDILWQMMIISMLVYQADEYMEATIGQRFQPYLQVIRDMITRLCQQCHTRTNLQGDSSSGYGTNGNILIKAVAVEPSLSEVERVLSAFVTHIVAHPKVTKASPSVQNELRHSLAAFVLAHITQIEDNIHLSSSKASGTANDTYSGVPSRTYYDWVHTTSADHTSCPFAFIFFTCLIDDGRGATQPSPLTGVRQRYFAQDVCRHLATMCRQYNDYGSFARDRAEGNLNSLDFPEFDSFQHGEHATAQNNTNDTDLENGAQRRAKQELIWLAEYERESLNHAMKELEKVTPKKVIDALSLFVNVTDLYGQIYRARDLTSRIK